MATVEANQPFELREYLQVLRTRKWSVILVLALVIGSAAFFSLRQTPIYEADTRLLVKPVPIPNSTVQPTVNLETEAEIVASHPVAQRVKEKIDTGASTEELLENITVEPAAELSAVLMITYSSTDPDFAAAAANSFAQSYIDYQQEQSLRNLNAAQDAVQAQIKGVQTQLARIIREIEAANPNTDQARVTTLETERATLLARLGVLQQRLDEVGPDQATQLGGGQIIEPASVPSTPASPILVKDLLLAAFLGIALGVGLAFLRERLDDRFKSREEIESALAAPVLAAVPRFPTRKGDPSSGLIVHTDPKSPASEAYRTLRTGLEFISSQRGTKTLLVTSPGAGEGKTLTSANLATALAQAGRRVALISADLRRPSIDAYFGVQSETGLSSWLAGHTVNLDSLCLQTDVENLQLISSGPIPPNPTELLTSERLVELLDALSRGFDYVVIDSPPVLPVADATALAARVSGTLIVIDSETTKRSAAIHAKENLERFGSRVLGCVLNAFDASSGSYYYYSSYYGSVGHSNGGRQVKKSRKGRKADRKAGKGASV